MNVDKSPFEVAYNEGRTFLLEHEALQVFESVGVKFPANILSKNLDEALKFARKEGYPIVIKAMSPKILHKSDFKAVVIGINNEEALQEKYTEMQSRLAKYDLVGILVEKQVKKGTELIIGMNIDSTFGPVVAFGIGGILVEALNDVTFRMCPTTKERALRMINEIKTQKMLNGFRGLPPVNRDALAEMIVKVSEMTVALGEYIKEIDLNPVIANEDGIFGVDARIILKPKN
ncbi:MAG: acetate--CoA ligase family protein [Candidatus Heimdallarchaeota archaeon]|nr:acetate--CoA ligase family protein [Candidatus Heimdallarchaeota archaeon]